jgi:hypothetical protein
MPWVLFRVPTPTPDGQSARDLYLKREVRIEEFMQARARELGCGFHRAWYAADGSAFYAVAFWESIEGAGQFFAEFDIRAEPGEETIHLEGDVGLVPLP